MMLQKAASFLKKRKGVMVMIDAWPFHAEVFKNSPPGAASAESAMFVRTCCSSLEGTAISAGAAESNRDRPSV